jgi:GTPase SAR1 family protein
MNETIKTDMAPYEPNKIYIIGDQGVGKSILVKRLRGEYVNEYNIQGSPMGIHSTQFYFQNCIITLKDLSDTPKWKYTKILSDDLEEIKAIMIVFSLNSKKTFEYAKMLIEYLIKDIKTSSNAPELLLIGNKNDLQGITESSEKINKEDNLSKEEIYEYLNSVSCLHYFQISCKENTNFRDLLFFINNLDLEINSEDEKKLKNKKRKSRRDRSCIIY